MFTFRFNSMLPLHVVYYRFNRTVRQWRWEAGLRSGGVCCSRTFRPPRTRTTKDRYAPLTLRFSSSDRHERLLSDSEQWRHLHTMLPSLCLRLYRISHHCREDGMWVLTCAYMTRTLWWYMMFMLRPVLDFWGMRSITDEHGSWKMHFLNETGGFQIACINLP